MIIPKRKWKEEKKKGGYLVLGYDSMRVIADAGG
jgi:hypothetical protein